MLEIEIDSFDNVFGVIACGLTSLNATVADLAIDLVSKLLAYKSSMDNFEGLSIEKTLKIIKRHPDLLMKVMALVKVIYSERYAILV